jgi:CheY-like chemotaxis protein
MDLPDAATMTGIASALSAGGVAIARWLGSSDRKKVRELDERLSGCEEKHADALRREAESLRREAAREAAHAAASATMIDTIVKLKRETGPDDTGVHQLLSHREAILRASTVPHQVAVLIVDDDEQTRRSLGRVLHHHGMIVMPASSVEDALRIIDDMSVDIVVADVLMPGRSGLDLLHALRKSKPRLPVILISGERELGKQLAHVEGVRFLAKPFQGPEIVALIDDALQATPVP